MFLAKEVTDDDLVAPGAKQMTWEKQGAEKDIRASTEPAHMSNCGRCSGSSAATVHDDSCCYFLRADCCYHSGFGFNDDDVAKHVGNGLRRGACARYQILKIERLIMLT